MPSFLTRLFTKSAPTTPEPVLHQGCRIYPAPQKAAGGYRVAARIEKDVAGQVKTHQLIRADVYSAQGTATEASIDKAKLAIDQLGDQLFG